MPSTASGRPAERTRAVASASRCTASVSSRLVRSSRFASPSALLGPAASSAATRSTSAVERVGGHDARDDASDARGLRIESAIGQGQLLRGAQPHEAGEKPRCAAVGVEPDPRVCHDEPCVVGRDHDVASTREAKARPGGAAVDGDDDRSVDPGKGDDRRVQVRRHLAQLSGQVLAPAERPEVPAYAEVGARTPQHDDANGCVTLGRDHGRVEVACEARGRWSCPPRGGSA